MIDLSKDPKGHERLEAICNNKHRDAGEWILYAEGHFGENVGLSKIGSTAMRLYEEGKVNLFQKRVSLDPLVCAYYAQVR